MSRWKTLIKRRRHELELRKELEFHVTERLGDLVRSGSTEPEARRIIRQEFGGLDQVRKHAVMCARQHG